MTVTVTVPVAFAEHDVAFCRSKSIPFQPLGSTSLDQSTERERKFIWALTFGDIWWQIGFGDIWWQIGFGDIWWQRFWQFWRRWNTFLMFPWWPFPREYLPSHQRGEEPWNFIDIIRQISLRTVYVGPRSLLRSSKYNTRRIQYFRSCIIFLPGRVQK